MDSQAEQWMGQQMREKKVSQRRELEFLTSVWRVQAMLLSMASLTKGQMSPGQLSFWESH
jgi:hypothetical protein